MFEDGCSPFRIMIQQQTEAAEQEKSNAKQKVKIESRTLKNILSVPTYPSLPQRQLKIEGGSSPKLVADIISHKFQSSVSTSPMPEPVVAAPKLASEPSST